MNKFGLALDHLFELRQEMANYEQYIGRLRKTVLISLESYGLKTNKNIRRLDYYLENQIKPLIKQNIEIKNLPSPSNPEKKEPKRTYIPDLKVLKTP